MLNSLNKFIIYFVRSLFMCTFAQDLDRFFNLKVLNIMNKEFIVSSELNDNEQFEKRIKELEKKYDVKSMSSDDFMNLKFGDKISHIELGTNQRVTYEFLCMHPENEKYCFLMNDWTKKDAVRFYIPNMESDRFYFGYNSQFMTELAILYHAHDIAYYLNLGMA